MGAGFDEEDGDGFGTAGYFAEEGDGGGGGGGGGGEGLLDCG